MDGLVMLEDDFMASIPAIPRPTVSKVADSSKTRELAAPVS